MADNLEYLYAIQTQQAPCIAELPGAERNTYAVNLTERHIDAPSVLSISSDHKAEVIYFVMDRYYDLMDLTNTSCLINYIAPDKKPYVYVVPYYDIYKYRNSNRMVIPWVVDGAATQKDGKVTFSLRFFRIEGEGPNAKLVYNLNTLPSETYVKKGLSVDPLNKEEVDFGTDAYTTIMQQISTLHRKGTYWEILD